LSVQQTTPQLSGSRPGPLILLICVGWLSPARWIFGSAWSPCGCVPRGSSVRLPAHSWGLSWDDWGSSWGLSFSLRSCHRSPARSSHRGGWIPAGPRVKAARPPGGKTQSSHDLTPFPFSFSGGTGRPRFGGSRKAPPRGVGRGTTRVYRNGRNSRPSSPDTANPRAQVARRGDDSRLRPFRLVGCLLPSSGPGRDSGAGLSCF